MRRDGLVVYRVKHVRAGLPALEALRLDDVRAVTLDPTALGRATTSLDPVSARRVDALIRELTDKLGVTSVLVSHDLVTVFSIAGRITMLYRGKTGCRTAARTPRPGPTPWYSSSSLDAPPAPFEF